MEEKKHKKYDWETESKYNLRVGIKAEDEEKVKQAKKK